MSSSSSIQQQEEHQVKNSSRKKILFGQPVESFSNIVGVDRKVKQACSIGGQVPASLQRLFLELQRDEDKELIADFIVDSYHEKNIAVKTKCTYISNLVYLSRYLGHKKSFKNMMTTAAVEEITGYLHSLKRPIEADPDQKWINTYNQRAAVICKFFRWLAYPDLRSEERVKQTPIPPVIKGIKTVKKKGPRSNVKATDLWTWEEDALFIKYCEDPRIACYHAMSRDTSARPSEILAMRIEDIRIKKDVNGKIYAEVQGVGRYGKTKKVRTIPLMKSLPFIKAWLAQHPQSNNPKAYLFVSLENSAKYRNMPLKASSLYGIYDNLRKHHFAKVLERPDVPPEEKTILKLLRENKPWNPYNRRHTALTEKVRLVNEYDLRQHAGWTKNSNMIETYTHDLGNESSEDLLLAYGIDVRSTATNNANTKSILEPKACPHCSEPNKPDAKFCSSCRMVLTFDGYNETKNEAEETKKKLEELEAKQKTIEINLRNFYEYTRATEAELMGYKIEKEGKIIIHDGRKVKALLDENGGVICYQKVVET